MTFSKQRRFQCVKTALSAQGMSLPEVLVCAGIIAILLQQSLPKLNILEQEESVRVLSDVAAAINLARTDAILNGRRVTLCAPGELPDCSNAWESGLLVKSADQLVHVQHWTSLQGRLSWRAFGNRPVLEFDTSGALLHQNGSFTWCPPSGSPVSPHQLIINGAGRLRLATDSDHDGIRENSQGHPLSC